VILKYLFTSRIKAITIISHSGKRVIYYKKRIKIINRTRPDWVLLYANCYCFFRWFYQQKEYYHLFRKW